MSNRGMIVALVVAIGLGVVALLLLRSPAATGSSTSETVAVGERILDVAPSGVVGVRIESGGRTYSIARTSGVGAAQPPSWAPDAEWLLSSPDAPNGDLWPIPSAQMQGLLRTFADAVAVATPERGASVGDKPTVVTLTLRSGPPRVVRLAARTLAGTGLVEIDAISTAGKSRSVVRAIVNDQLHRVCANPGPPAWRDRTVLATAAPDASRIELTGGGAKISLAKVDGRWMLREPTRAPGDGGAVSALLGTLAKVQIAAFSDEVPPGAQAGLEKPTARVVLETDRRVLGSDAESAARVVTSRVALAVGLPADAKGSRVFASLDGGPAMQIDAAGLAGLTMDPGAYITAHPLQAASADVQRLSMQFGGIRREFERADTRWNERRAGQPMPVPLAGADLREFESLVTFLTGTAPPGGGGKAERPKVSIAPPPGLASRGVLRARAGAAEFEIEVLASGRDSVTLRSGTVWRTYPLSGLPGLLAAVAENATPAAAGASDQK